jgi:ABC-type Fe3+-hydroxamate transport system substrate-binding protein
LENYSELKNKLRKVFKNIENNYKKIQTLASKTSNKPNILCNEMYGSQWFLPGGNSFVARLIMMLVELYSERQQRIIFCAFEF